jgi:hypothetical protein
LTLSVRDRTPEKNKGKEAGDVEEQSSERKSTRGPAEREFFSEESAFAPSFRQKRIIIAKRTRVFTLVKRAVLSREHFNFCLALLGCLMR